MYNKDPDKRMALVPLKEYNELVDFKNKVGFEKLIRVTTSFGNETSRTEFISYEDAINKLNNLDQSKIENLHNKIENIQLDYNRRIDQLKVIMTNELEIELTFLAAKSIFEFMAWRKERKMRKELK